jgi:hypothetical protein
MGLARMCMRVQEGYSVDLLIGSQKIQMRTLHSRPRLFYLSSTCRSRPSHPAHICARTSLRQPTPIARCRCATPPRFRCHLRSQGAARGGAMRWRWAIVRTVRCCGPSLRLRFRADFLSAAECDYIISRSESQLSRSEAHPPTQPPTHPPNPTPTNRNFRGRLRVAVRHSCFAVQVAARKDVTSDVAQAVSEQRTSQYAWLEAAQDPKIWVRSPLRRRIPRPAHKNRSPCTRTRISPAAPAHSPALPLLLRRHS